MRKTHSRDKLWQDRSSQKLGGLRPKFFLLLKQFYTVRRLTLAYAFLDRVLELPGVQRTAKFVWDRYIATRPQRIAVHITERCNLNCSYCYVDHHRASLSIERWLEIVDEGMRDLGLYFVQILGGEPFLHPRFEWFLEQLVDRGLIVAINTNATMLDDRWVARLRRLDPGILLFVNFDHRDAYQKLSGEGADYDLVFRNILRARRAGLFTTVFLTVTRLNYPHIESFIDMLDAHDIRSVVERCLPVNADTAGLEVSAAEWSALNRKLSASGKIPSPNRVLARMTGSTCQDYGRIMYITATGEVLPCAFAPEELSVGNVERENLARLWQRLLDRSVAWHQIPDSCRGCAHEKTCGGGCKTHAYLKSGRFDVRDPLCYDRSVPPTVLGL